MFKNGNLIQVALHDPSTYNLSFTAASLRPELARIIAETYISVGENWDRTKDRILSTNALQSRSKSSAVRMERELRQRLALLSHGQLTLLAHATAEDRAAISWLAALKHVNFAFEFASELLREKVDMQDFALRPSDYENFWATKSISHPELKQLAESSKNKVRQVLLLMLVEVGILDSKSQIRPLVISPAITSVVRDDNPRWLAGFLVPDSEIGGQL